MKREYYDAMTIVKALRTYLEKDGKNLGTIRELAYLKTSPIGGNMKVEPIMPIQPVRNPPKWRAQVSLRFEDEVIIDSVTGERFEVEKGAGRIKFNEIQGKIHDSHA